MARVSHFYFSSAEAQPGLWQGCAQAAYERTDGNGTHHVRGPRKVYTLPKYPGAHEANEAAQRLARSLWGSSLPAVNDNTDERDVTMTGAKEYGRHG